MMQSWKREMRGARRISGDRGKFKEELELTKIDTLIMQVTRMNRAVAEVNESCLCLEEFISKEKKDQAELQSELKASSTLNILRNQQHLLTKANLQASMQLVRNHIEREESENRRREEEIMGLIKRMENMKESKITKLNEIKDHYGSQLVDKEKIEQKKKVIELKHKKNILTTCITKFKQEKQKKGDTEWKNFVEAVIKMAELHQVTENEHNSLQQYKASVQMLQTAVLPMKQADSSSVSREHAGDMNQVMKNRSPSLHAKQPDLITARTADRGPVNTSSSTNQMLNQGYGTTLSRSSFNTSLSFLKIPHSKLGEKKIDDYSQSTEIYSGGPLETLFSENHPQVAAAHSSHQVQHQEATPDYHKTSPSQLIEVNNMSHLSSVKSQHDPRGKTMWGESSIDKSVSNSQGSSRFALKPISFPPAVVSSTNAQSLETPSYRSIDISCSSFIPKALKTPLPITKTSSISPKVWKGVGMSSLKLKSAKFPLSRTKGTEASVPKGLGIPHLNLRGIPSQCLLSRCAGVPIASRVVGISSVPPKSFGICSPTPYQKTYQKYSGHSLDNTELSRLSLTSKSEICKEAQQEFPILSDHSEEAPIKRDKFGHSTFPEKSVTSGISVGDGLPRSSTSTLPSNQDETTSSSQVPQPMEVDSNEYPKTEETSLPTSQEDMRIAEDSGGNKAQLQDSSPEMTQNLHSHNKAVNKICFSKFMKSSSTKDKPHSSEDSEQISTTITSTPKNAVESNLEMGCATPLVVSISNSVSSSQSSNSVPSKASFQFSSMKSQEYKQSPVTSDITNHSSQQFSSNNPVEDTSFPFLFQNSLQASSMGNQPFNLFGSPVAESTAQSSSVNSGSNFFMFENTPNLRQENTNTGLFNFDLGSDGESREHSSGFLSSLFDNSCGNNSSSDENTGFRLF